MSSAFFTLGSGEIAWLALACATGIALILYVNLQRKIAELKRRVSRHSRSIANMDEWADDVDAKLAAIHAESGKSNDNDGYADSTTRPFLESYIQKISAKHDMDAAKVRSIIFGLKRPPNKLK